MQLSLTHLIDFKIAKNCLDYSYPKSFESDRMEMLHLKLDDDDDLYHTSYQRLIDQFIEILTVSSLLRREYILEEPKASYVTNRGNPRLLRIVLIIKIGCPTKDLLTGLF